MRYEVEEQKNHKEEIFANLYSSFMEHAIYEFGIDIPKKLRQEMFNNMQEWVFEVSDDFQVKMEESSAMDRLECTTV